MQICEYFFENACYSVTKYYLCKQNNKRSLLGRKQQSQVARSFPNRYLFSYTNKVTSLFSISCILDIILHCKRACFKNSRRCCQEGREKVLLNVAECLGTNCQTFCAEHQTYLNLAMAARPSKKND